MCLLLILCAGTKLACRQGGGRDDVDTLRRHHVILPFPGILNRISISICKLRNYLYCVTSKGKGPRTLDVSATFSVANQVTL